MKKILLILVLFSTINLFSQEYTFENEVLKISKRIETITKTQKDSLQVKVININKRLEKKEITQTAADILKREVAFYHANQIEKLVSEQERLLQLLVQDKTNGKIVSSSDVSTEDEENIINIGSKTFRFTMDNDNNDDDENERSEARHLRNRTSSQFVFGFGMNNVLKENQFTSLNDSEYQFWKSRFYEVGYTWSTRVDSKPSKLYFKYGFSFVWNNLRLKNNQFHVKNEDITTVQVFPINLKESRLRHVQMNFPMHIEWDFSKKSKYSDGAISDRSHNSVKIGLGGFLGFKLGTRQFLEFRDTDGVDIEQVQFNNFNMNTLNYGLSAYLGYKSTSLYLKYDLNPLFKNTEIRNISMGLRFDFF